jgi:hypothetical protein
MACTPTARCDALLIDDALAEEATSAAAPATAKSAVARIRAVIKRWRWLLSAMCE